MAKEDLKFEVSAAFSPNIELALIQILAILKVAKQNPIPMKTHQYSNGDITILWKPDICAHSGICVKMLPQVYNPNERPWIKIDNASTEELIHQVLHCPSGALSILKEKNDKD